MIWLAEATVHTSGINWASVITIITAVSVAIGGLFAYVARQVTRTVTNSITTAINNFHLSVVSVLTTRLSIVETKQDDMNDKIDDLMNTRGRDKYNDSSDV